ncbi:uncharacterized protein BX663DRAFT_549436 [Cokeromyces recurvatus]|uniref:uncharacterized protein n=1 Tax=Cokeromyces recurvatus TaxID=90255 RepID=UPI00221EE0C4|nr:uncharacterized protein BX663DRAFT_549436 [Cokeromyces recurvatus]KAI7905434.1 hypothetical protein BX663DRAFT_549436 [Cokeromyces recurvatus]
MSLINLPNEIFIKILKTLSIDDQKTCMQVCHSWHDRFQLTVMKCLYIKSRKQFKEFFNKLKSTQNENITLGQVILRLDLDPTVGMINSEFHLLPLYCPFLEIINFNPELWRYFTYAKESMTYWRYIIQYPRMERLKLAFPILYNNGQTLTHLEFGSVIIDQLAETRLNIISLLSYTPNLLSLKLSDGITVSHTLSISDFESIHTLCPKLQSLHLESFELRLVTKDVCLIDIKTLPVASHLKNLSLNNLSINSEEFLQYWAHKYSNIESLDIQLRLLEPEYYHEAIWPENSSMKEYFAMMASSFVKLRKLKARFDDKYFPGDVFLRGINTIGLQLEEVSLHFFNFDYHRRNAHQFKILINNSICTLTSISISNWDRNWEYEEDILRPIRYCSQLVDLSLSPQLGTLIEFDIDVFLDKFPCLKRLELANTYNLFIEDETNANINNVHHLEELSLRHTMVNNQLFDYLSIRCPYLNTLRISNFTKPYDNDIQVKVNMPHHDFKSIQIKGLHLGLRIEDAGFQCNHYSTLCSLEETSKTEQKLLKRNNHELVGLMSNSNHMKNKKQNHAHDLWCAERWYHLYQPKYRSNSRKSKYNNNTPRFQRLNNSSIMKIKQLDITHQLWEQISFVGSRIKYEDKKHWYLDIPYGWFSVRCRSVKEFSFEGITI